MATSFERHSKVIASALSLCEQMYQGSLGNLTPPHKSRMAIDPLNVIRDMMDVLEAAGIRLVDVVSDASWHTIEE